MLTAGTMVAGYRIERVLGAGGMGAVYVVANPELPRRDALKVLSSELSHNAEFRTRFVREADVASMLDHPNIVSIYRRGQTDEGLLWIAMQFVDGTDADAALQAGTMTPTRAIHIVTEVAKALDYAHAHQVVHRDVKPANFLLSGPIGGDERVLLGDFGIARAYDDAGLTATGSLVATIAYAAPEILAGDTVDGRADIYSLGCTLFRLITGKTPYPTSSGMPAVMMAHLQAPPPRVSDHIPGLPTALDVVIAKAMAKNPDQRFASARELAAAAAGSLNDRSIASTTTPWRPVPPADVTSYPNTPAMHPPWAPGYGPHTPPGVAAAHTQHRPPPFGPPVAPRRRRGRLVLAAAAASLMLAGAVFGAITLSRHHSDEHPKATAPQPISTTTTPAPPPMPLPPKVLNNLLPTTEEVAQIMGAAELAVFKSVDSLIDESPVIDNKNCIGAFAPAENAVYGNAGWTAARAQAVHEPGPVPIAFEVLQAAIEFPTADAAQKVFSDQITQWSACAGTDFTITYPNTAPAHWKFGALTKTDTVISIPQRWNGPGLPATGGCQRAMEVRNNVIADVWACRLSIVNQGVDLAHAIITKLPH
jgi:eukaryotic-like serine/threonine-protein kinase